jgi:hypothetical protein
LTQKLKLGGFGILCSIKLTKSTISRISPLF